MGLISLRIAQLIDAAVPELVAGASLLNDWFPTAPDKIVCVNELPGLPPVTMYEDIPVTSEASIQVKTRTSADNTSATCRELAWTVHRVLWTMADVAGAVPTDPRILVVQVRHDPVLLERDDTDRVVYVGNYFVSASWSA